MERIEQKILNINTHGLVRILGKSTKIQSTEAEPQREERFFSMQSISQEKSLAVEINRPEGNGPEWFFCSDTLEVFYRGPDFMRERRDQSTDACLPF